MDSRPEQLCVAVTATVDLMVSQLRFIFFVSLFVLFCFLRDTQEFPFDIVIETNSNFKANKLHTNL